MNWIDTSERVPQIGVRVLVWPGGYWPGWMEAIRSSSGLWYAPTVGQIYPPTHWCEIVPPGDA